MVPQRLATLFGAIWTDRARVSRPAFKFKEARWAETPALY
jgi:hypothetical protein